MRIKYFLFFLFLPLWAASQDIEISGNGQVESVNNRTFEFTIEVEKIDDLSFRSLQLSFSNYNYTNLFYTEYGSEKSRKQAFSIDPHVNENKLKNELISSLIFIKEDTKYIVFELTAAEYLLSLDYAYTILYQAPIISPSSIVNQNECECPSPEYFNREAWDCPWGEDSSIFVPEYSKITHIVIHHSASIPQKPYASSVKGIWSYHVNGNGWSDIGYHWLIDPDGGIYKGRAWLDGDENIQGAHMCACNSNKMGICLLGDFTINEPTTEQYNALINFLASKSCQLEIEPILSSDGTSRISGSCSDEFVNHVIGHKDGCPSGYTACPGDAFHPSLNTLKNEVQKAYESCLADVSTTNTESIDYDIFPNPNNGTFTIRSKVKNFTSAPKVTDLNGNKIYVSVNRNNAEIILKMDVTPGIYILFMDNHQQKIIVY